MPTVAGATRGTTPQAFFTGGRAGAWPGVMPAGRCRIFRGTIMPVDVDLEAAVGGGFTLFPLATTEASVT